MVFLVSHVGNTQNPKKLFESFQENSLNFVNTLVLKISTMEIENILVFLISMLVMSLRYGYA